MTLFFYYVLQLVEFLVVISLGIALVSFFFYHISNSFNLKFINIYGFFSSMDDFSLIMLSSAILKEITLLYCIIKLNDPTNLYLYIFIVFCFTYAFFSFKVLTFTKELLISMTEYLILYFLKLLSSFLVEIQQSILVESYIWILSIILIACSIYFFVRNLHTIVIRHKSVRRNLIVK